MIVGIPAGHGVFELKVKLIVALQGTGYKLAGFGELVAGVGFRHLAVPRGRAA